jgi:integrase
MGQARHGKRRRLAIGIYAGSYGIEIVARIGSGAHAQTASRFVPPDTDLDWCKAERFRMLADLRDAPTGRRGAGTLAADIQRYLEQCPASAKTTDYRYILAHWIASPLATLPRDSITLAELEQQLAHWQAAGVPAVTLNHRIRALRAVYRAFRDGVEPVVPDALRYFRPPRPEPRGIPMSIVARILASIPDRGQARKGEARPTYSETKIRLRVIAYTGLPHRQLVAVTRAMVNFADGRLFMPERKKGTGAAGVWVSLLPQAIEALHDYDAAHLWGIPFSRSAMRKTWTKAIARTRTAIETECARTGDAMLLEQFMTSVPPDCRPYDLRHSFLTEVYRRSGDFRAVAAIGQHAQLETTKRYTEAGVPERVQAAIEKVAAAWIETLPPTPPALRPRLRKSLTLIRRPDRT